MRSHFGQQARTHTRSVLIFHSFRHLVRLGRAVSGESNYLPSLSTYIHPPTVAAAVIVVVCRCWFFFGSAAAVAVPLCPVHIAHL